MIKKQLVLIMTLCLLSTNAYSNDEDEYSELSDTDTTEMMNETHDADDMAAAHEEAQPVAKKADKKAEKSAKKAARRAEMKKHHDTKAAKKAARKAEKKKHKS